MEQELQEMSVTLFNLYVKNLEFLKENFEDIYKKVDIFSNEINQGTRKEKYSLEFKDEGYFDIYNLEDKTWFYHTNSYEDADFRAKHSNFTKDGSLDLLRKGVNGTLSKSQSYKDVLPIVDYFNDIIDFENIEFEKIYKFVFIGTGVGVHIHEIYKKLNSFVTLIVEPDLEIFRLSLFLIDYSEFMQGERKLFLSVKDSKKERNIIFEQFYRYQNFMNYNIKHHLLVENDSYILQELKEYFSNNTVTSFPYALTLENIHRTIGFVKDKYRFFDTTLVLDKKILTDKPVLMIAAGPSLDNYIEWIKQYQDKFYVVCVDVILRKLEKYSIVPDIVFTIDPSHLCAKYLTTDDKNYLNNSAIVCLSQQDESVLNALEGKNIYFSQCISLISEIGYMGSVSNVGTFAFMMSIHFGATQIFTIGNDAAFNQETGSRYSKDSTHTQMDIHIQENRDESLISHDDVIEVEGNLRSKVKTNRQLLTFKDSFESILHSLQSFYEDNIFEVYNLSDGVKLEGFQSMTYEELDKYINKIDILQKNAPKLIDSITKVIDNLDYSDDIKLLNSMITRAQKKKKIKLKHKNHFLNEKLEFMVWILEKSKKTTSPLIGNMFLQYTELVDIYINYYLNLRQKNIHDEKYINKVYQMWIMGVIGVLKDIKKAID